MKKWAGFPFWQKGFMCHQKGERQMLPSSLHNNRKTPSMAQLWAIQQTVRSELQPSCLSTKNPILKAGKSPCCPGVGTGGGERDWTPRVYPQSAFRVVTLWKSHSSGQRLMGSCGNEMDGWVSWLGAARTEKGCAARRREATSHDCKNMCTKDILHADIGLKCVFSYLFKIFASTQTVWHNSEKKRNQI